MNELTARETMCYRHLSGHASGMSKAKINWSCALEVQGDLTQNVYYKLHDEGIQVVSVSSIKQNKEYVRLQKI